MATTLIQGVKAHPSVLKKDKDHILYRDNVENWLKFNNEQHKILAKAARKGHKESLAQSLIHEGYVKEIRHYLRTGDWISDFFGRDQEHITIRRTIVA
tara:strand:- start:45 stop:338 length:294 start_codon:yes stop_codon:yes gene_type:complete